MAIATASLLLGLALPALDAWADSTPGWVFQGGVDGARSVLGTIAGAMISVTGLVFSITIVVLQLASSQFSPRILRSFLESRVVQLTLGFFTGSFVYALTVLRAVRGGDDAGVPQLAVTASYLYVVVAVAMFLAFIHHITTSVQVSHVMGDVRRRTIAAARRLSPGEPEVATWSPRPGAPRVELHHDDRCGYLTTIDGVRLGRLARELGAVVELTVTPGDHLVPGGRIGRIWADEVPDDVHREVAATLGVAAERDVAADPGFGVRQLLDIADRALSPGVNDPTTAVQAVNELHVVLLAVGRLRDPSPYLAVDGEVVALHRPRKYAALLDGAVAELVHHGRDAPRVLGRLDAVLEELRGAVRPEHRAATDAALARLRTARRAGDGEDEGEPVR